MSDETADARIGKNEAIFREANDRLEDVNRGKAAVTDGLLHVLCECADRDCTEQLAVPTSEYERVRSDATHFLVAPGHEDPSLEVVIAERGRYLVVRKQGDAPERIARATDPRA